MARARDRIKIAKKNNAAIISELKRTAEGIPWLALLAVAGESYKVLVESTYQDSGNFAYNWWLEIGGPRTRTGLESPKALMMKGQDPVGVRGEARGAGHPAVVNAALEQYGLNKEGSATVGSRMVREMADRKFRVIRIVNYLGDKKYGRYAENARMSQERVNLIGAAVMNHVSTNLQVWMNNLESKFNEPNRRKKYPVGLPSRELVK